MIYGALAIAAVALVSCSGNKEQQEQQEQQNENAAACDNNCDNNCGDNVQAYQVDVEAAQVDKVNTPDGPVTEVVTQDQITPEN